MTGAELRRHRDKLGMTQAEFARRLGVKRLTVLRWEKDQVKVPKTVELAIRQIAAEEK